MVVFSPHAYGNYFPEDVREFASSSNWLEEHGYPGSSQYATTPSDIYYTSNGDPITTIAHPIHSHQHGIYPSEEVSDQNQDAGLGNLFHFDMKRYGQMSRVSQASHADLNQAREHGMQPGNYGEQHRISGAHQGGLENKDRLAPISQERQIRYESPVYHNRIAEEHRIGYTNHKTTEYNQYANKFTSEPLRIGYGYHAPKVDSQSSHRYPQEPFRLEFRNPREIPDVDLSRRYAQEPRRLENAGEFDGQSSNGARRTQNAQPEGRAYVASSIPSLSFHKTTEETRAGPTRSLEGTKDIAGHTDNPDPLESKGFWSADGSSRNENKVGELSRTGSHATNYQLPIDKTSKDHMQDKLNRISKLLQTEIFSPTDQRQAIGRVGECFTTLNDVHGHLNKYYEELEKLAGRKNVIASKTSALSRLTSLQKLTSFNSKRSLSVLITQLKNSLVRLESVVFKEPSMSSRLHLSAIIFLMIDFLSESKLIESSQRREILSQRLFESISAEVNLRFTVLSNSLWAQGARTVSVIHYTDSLIDENLRNFFSGLETKYVLATYVQVLRKAAIVRSYDSVTRGEISSHIHTVATKWTAEEFLKFCEDRQAPGVFNTNSLKELVHLCRNALLGLPGTNVNLHYGQFLTNFQLLNFLVKLDDAGYEVISSQWKPQILAELSLLDKVLLIHYIKHFRHPGDSLSPPFENELQRLSNLYQTVSSYRAQLSFKSNTCAAMLISHVENFLNSAKYTR
ncbi:hypothetical protein O181_038922 [Austropuccinia psidii MF-1]|uniref:Uncharacterized protein n=1 Tax=Austropuccinia psidii MF-1 TaxID=1389203 RepID=A0A9Q3DBV8_9BASI|nr:hypothetical protein [Austropuccinia psidii MF-1]